MNILMTGGTGFIGSNLVQQFIANGDHVYIMTRRRMTISHSKQVTYLNFNHPVEQLQPIDVVINLAGESLFGYWTKAKKQRILLSRLTVTEKLLELIKQLPVKPKVFISASAVVFMGQTVIRFLQKERRHQVMIF